MCSFAICCSSKQGSVKAFQVFFMGACLAETVAETIAEKVAENVAETVYICTNRMV